MFLVVLTFFFCENINAKCLKDLSVVGYNLSPSFDGNTYKYNVFINGNSILIKGKGIAQSQIDGLGSYNVLKDKEDLEIKCNDETYVISVIKSSYKKEDDDAYLERLYVEGYDIVFDKNKFEYEIESESIPNIDYEPSNSKATVSLKELDDKILISVISYDNTKSNQYIIKVNKIRSVMSDNKKSSDFNKLTTFQNISLIIILVIINIFIMLFLKKKLFNS